MPIPALLLDAHLSLALAAELSVRDIDTAHVATWQQGRWRTADDATLLAVAASEHRILVSLDAATLPALARGWAEEHRTHAGLLVISSRINQTDIGSQLSAIRAALDAMHDRSWVNQTVYTRRA